ncbi:AMP-binding enzyme family protein [Leishmania donovani]|uniref:AMP-binding enzyme family protein n=1 Tax=Leishmania donovani TaxID=5661 RepID=A0A504Y2Q9_LEIDO|nr:AMP-binding enzyme family protein [Leishmania donovani]
MSSNVPVCVGDGATLSACIPAALEERGDDEVMFALLRHRHCGYSKAARLEGSSGAVDGSEASITAERVTKRAWCAFVELLKRRIITSSHDRRSLPLAGGAHGTPGDERGAEDECDVGVYSQETFYTCLVESVCLCMGWTFCLFRPDDPPLRLQRLEQRRRPRCKLRSEDISSLLHEALSAEENSACNGKLQMAEVGTATPTRLPVVHVDDSRVAYYIYTSGSTGDPKCVVASRGNLRAYLQRFILDKDGLAVGDACCRFFCLSSPFFDPSIGDMLVGLCTPHSIFYTCTQEDLLNGQAAPLLACVQPTHVVSTPAVWSSLTTAGHLLSVLPSSTAPMKVFLGGERMSQALISTWADRAELYNIYGVTEATIYQSVWRVFPGTRAEHVKCGPGVGTRVRVQRLDAASDVLLGDSDAFALEEGLLQELGESAGDDYGEVVLCGDQVCCGYAEDSTSSPFGCDAATGERFFRTGDIGRLVSTGEGGPPDLELRGRRDWEMKLNGQRVALEEVEGTVQRALAGLFSQCACFCVQSASGTPAIGAAVVLTDVVDGGLLRDHREGVAAALQELLALHLPSFMVPRRWLLFTNGASLPQTPTGKVSRTQLAVDAVQEQQEELDAQLNEKNDGCCREEDELYRVVQSVWQRMLGMPVRCDTHYLHAGGDSLGALKLSRAVYLGLHAGSDAGIDEHGRLPPPFQPCVLLQHPRFGDYVQALREAWAKAPLNGESKPENGETVTALPLLLQPPQVLSPAEAAADSLFREVVAVQCAGIADRLLRHGLADVNGHNRREHRCTTPLHVAVASCCSLEQELATLRVVEVLLQHGARLTAVTLDGVTAAHLAASRSAAILRRLLEHDQAVVHCRDARQQSLLHFAARSGNAETARLLRQYGLKIDTRDKWQRTPAHWAVLNGHTAVLEEMALYCTSSATTISAAAATRAPEPNDVGAKRRRCPGNETARFTRLARKKTYLAYETLHEIARRLHPTDHRIKRLCDILAPSVGEASATE